MSAEELKVLDRMRVLCSRREYCRSDIFSKALRCLDGNIDAAETIVASLEKDGYLCELRYASSFARDKSVISGWGEKKIRYMLASKGVPRDIISQALEEIDSSSADARLVKLLENKYRSLKDDPQCRLKMLRFGLGRGYDYEKVESVLKDIIRLTDLKQ